MDQAFHFQLLTALYISQHICWLDIPPPFPVFESWTKFREDEIFD